MLIGLMVLIAFGFSPTKMVEATGRLPFIVFWSVCFLSITTSIKNLIELRIKDE